MSKQFEFGSTTNNLCKPAQTLIQLVILFAKHVIFWNENIQLLRF